MKRTLPVFILLAACCNPLPPMRDVPRATPKPPTTAEVQAAQEAQRVQRAAVATNEAAHACTPAVIDGRACVVCRSEIAFRALIGINSGGKWDVQPTFRDYRFPILAPSCDFSQRAGAEAAQP